MSTITVSVNGNSVTIIEGSLKLSDRTNQRRSYQFVIRDDAGTAIYKKGMPVTFTDSVLGTIYNGFLNAPKATNLYPNAMNLWACDTVDMLWLADKRSSDSVYTNQYSGVIVGDQLNILNAEGVWANLALDYNHLLSDWTTGATLAGTQATSNAGDGNPGDGDLELALAGSTVTKSESTTSDFSGGTLTNVQAASNALTLTSYATGMAMTGTCIGNVGNAFQYWGLYGTATSQPNDWLLEYTVWIDPSSPLIEAGIDIVYTDGTTLRDYHQVDQHGLDCHPGRDLTGWANGQWFYRRIGLWPFTGKTIAYITAAFEGDTGGNYGAYFHDIKLTYLGVTKIDVSGSFTGGWQVSNNGYAHMSVKKATVYEKSGTRYSNLTSLTAAGLYRSSQVAWKSTEPANTSVALSTSIDGGASYQAATNQSAIVGPIAGGSLSGKTLKFQEVLTNTGNTPLVTPSLTTVSASVYPAYSASINDVIYSRTTQSDFNLGTLSNTLAGTNGSLGLNGYWKDWVDADLSGQNVFGTASPVQSIFGSELALSTNNGTDVRSELTNAGQWQNFTTSVVVQIPSSSSANIGLVYRTTGWVNGNDTYAYVAYLNTTGVFLDRGTNGGASTVTHITSASIALTANGFYTLKLVVNGTNHKIYVDDVLYINQTDATYGSAGYIGCRLYNATGGTLTGYFGSFAVVAALSGTYTSENLSLNAVGTVGNSIILWNESIPSGDSNLIQTSIDGGSTWQTATNGAAIPSIPAGTSVVGKNLLVKSTLTAGAVNDQPTLDGYTVWVISAYSSSGTWTSPALSLTSVGRAGATLVNWNAIEPANTGLTVKTSVDGGGSYQTITAQGNAIPNLTVTPPPWVDVFSANSSADYSSANYGGGANGTWTWDTANSRLIGSGGTNAVLQYADTSRYGSAIYGQSYYGGVSSLFSLQDGYAIADFNWSDGGGLFIRMTDANHLYYVIVNDASAGSNPNTLRLFKYISGTVTQLGTTQTIVFTRGSYVRIKLSAVGTALTVSLNGTQLISVTDSSIGAAGATGFLSGTKIQAYSLRVQPLGQSLSGLSVLTQLTLTSTDPTATPQVLDTSTFVSDGSVQAGNKISAADYRDTIVSSNIDDQNKQSNGWWTILASKQLISQQQLATPAPWCLQSVADLSASNLLIAGLSMENSGDLYRNRQKLKGVNATQAYSKSFTGDGKVTSWTLNYPIAPNTTPTIKLNGIVQSIGIQGVDTGKAFYYQPGSTTIQQDAAGTVLLDIDVLEVDYTGSYTTTVTRNNTGQFPGTVSQSQYAAIATANGSIGVDSGIVEQVLDVSNQNMDVATAEQYGDQLLQRYGVIGRIFTFMTLMSGLAIGQQLPIFLPCFSANNVQALVTQVDVTERITGAGIQYWWNCTATEGPALDSWSKVLAGAID